MPLHTRILIGLAVGVVGGSLSRLLFGESPFLLSFTTYVTEPFGRLFLRLIFMGVDRILDMSRTVLNVTGDVTAAVYVAHSEGRLPSSLSAEV